MIDLHMHTTYSDGTENVETVLKKSEEKHLEYISITDHNTALAYDELESKDISKFYSGESSGTVYKNYTINPEELPTGKYTIKIRFRFPKR